MTSGGGALPGEDGPLPMRYGGEPITDAEALGVARRLARLQAAAGRRLSSLAEPDQLPAANAAAVSYAVRVPPRLLLRARAKAEMEGRSLTSVILDALEGYASSSPGSRQRWTPPRIAREADGRSWSPPVPRVRVVRRTRQGE